MSTPDYAQHNIGIETYLKMDTIGDYWYEEEIS